jgi:hypothetical protein
MATIARTPMIDDDGSGTTGTVINAAWKTELYDQIDAALALIGGGAHAPSHNTGGSDPITALAASVITSGTIDPARLPALQTWTPSFGTQNTPIPGATYNNRSGWSIVLGDLVVVGFDVYLSNKGTPPAGLQLSIVGLPVPVRSGTLQGGGVITLWYQLAVAHVSVQINPVPGQPYLACGATTTATVTTGVLTTDHLTNTTNLRGVAIYAK